MENDKILSAAEIISLGKSPIEAKFKKDQDDKTAKEESLPYEQRKNFVLLGKWKSNCHICFGRGHVGFQDIEGSLDKDTTRIYDPCPRCSSIIYTFLDRATGLLRHDN